MRILLQTPAPLPPSLPADPNFLVSQVQEAVLVILALAAATIIAVKVLGPIARAWARRIEGKSVDLALREDLDQLHGQLAEVDHLRNKVMELEERLDFTERLLAQRKDQGLLQKGERG
jgi:Tfp pilus assembly protein PilO